MKQRLMTMAIALMATMAIHAQQNYMEKAIQNFVSNKHVKVSQQSRSGTEEIEGQLDPIPWKKEQWYFSMPLDSKSEKLIKTFIDAYEKEKSNKQTDFVSINEALDMTGQGLNSNMTQPTYLIHYAKSEEPILLSPNKTMSLIIVRKSKLPMRTVYAIEWGKKDGKYSGRINIIESNSSYSGVKPITTPAAAVGFGPAYNNNGTTPTFQTGNELANGIDFYHNKIVEDPLNESAIYLLTNYGQDLIMNTDTVALKESLSKLKDSQRRFAEAIRNMTNINERTTALQAALDQTIKNAEQLLEHQQAVNQNYISSVMAPSSQETNDNSYDNLSTSNVYAIENLKLLQNMFFTSTYVGQRKKILNKMLIIYSETKWTSQSKAVATQILLDVKAKTAYEASKTDIVEAILKQMD